VSNRWHVSSFVYVMADSWQIFVLLSKVSFYSSKTTDYFIDQFKFISVQVVGDVIYFVFILDHLSYFSL
jgi:hypothetical protein